MSARRCSLPTTRWRGRAGAGVRGARVRVGVGAGAFAHPGVAQVAVSVGRRAAEAVLRRDGPVRVADRRGGGRPRRSSSAPASASSIQRDPIQTAKLVASLDQVSGGRFLFGVGGGWNADEMADHGTEFKTRFKLMRERIEAMKEIWTEIKPEYHGEMVDFPPMMTWPKPVQKPHPPIIVGGMFPHAARRALRYGDGWIPHSRRPQYEDVTDYLPQFRQMAAEAGRDLAEVPVTVWGIRPRIDRLKRYRDQGVARGVVQPARRRADTDHADARPLGRDLIAQAAVIRTANAGLATAAKPGTEHDGTLQAELPVGARWQSVLGRRRPAPQEPAAVAASRAARLFAATGCSEAHRGLQGLCRPRRAARRGAADRARRQDRLFRGDRVPGPREADSR